MLVKPIGVENRPLKLSKQPEKDSIDVFFGAGADFQTSCWAWSSALWGITGKLPYRNNNEG